MDGAASHQSCAGFVTLNLTMDLLWMILLVVLVCAEDQNVTEVKVERGQDVILNCSQDISDIYWYLEVHSRLRGCIVRSFSATDSRPMYCSPEFKAKYSLVANRHVVRDVTAEDCRLHFCAKKTRNITHFVDTFRLVSDVPTTSPTSSSETHNADMQHSWSNLMELVVFISSTINAVLNLVLAICESTIRDAVVSLSCVSVEVK
ncbi:uncharacterized protein [Channa argus]|uniref:uncharacterized protein n=1 Tax=Channa argus TaxID=215402 RepID=UPI0035203B08